MPLLFMPSLLFFCYADTRTNALAVYHQVRGLYLMWSWLMLVADFYPSLFRLRNGLVPLRAERMLNSHLPFLVRSVCVDLETKLELKFCRKFWIELGNSQHYEFTYATNIVFAFVINSVNH